MANVVLTFGSDNSPKADPSDNVLYRDIDLDVQLDSYSNIIEIAGVLSADEGLVSGQEVTGYVLTCDVSPYYIANIDFSIQPINWDSNKVWPLLIDEYDVNHQQLSVSFKYIAKDIGGIVYPEADWRMVIGAKIQLSSTTHSNIGNNMYSTYTVKQLIDINAVANSLNNIFSWTPGERVLDPEFGTNLRKVLFEGITAQNSELIRAEVRNAISKYEPRIQIQDIYDISTTDDTENNTVQMRIVYSVPTLPGQLFTYDYFALKR